MEGCHRNFSSDVVHLELENFALPSKSTSPDPRLKIVGSLGKKMVHACMSPPGREKIYSDNTIVNLSMTCSVYYRTDLTR